MSRLTIPERKPANKVPMSDCDCTQTCSRPATSNNFNNLGQTPAKRAVQLRALRNQRCARLEMHERRLVLQRARAGTAHRRPSEVMTETMGPRRGIGPTDSCMNDARAWRRLTRVAVSAALYAFHPLFLDGRDLRARSSPRSNPPPRMESNADMPLEIWSAVSLSRCSEATNRG